jgi:hypothetical protein
MSRHKVLLTYKDDDGNFQIESVWATMKGNYYEINNIPFFASNIALGDLISVEHDDGALYFDELIEPSGHSAIQIVFFDEKYMKQAERELEVFGCTWEGSHIKTLIAVDVPKNISYSIVKGYLDKGEKESKWSYKESCLAHNVSNKQSGNLK